jgi:hypothetical protein
LRRSLGDVRRWSPRPEAQGRLPVVQLMKATPHHIDSPGLVPLTKVTSLERALPLRCCRGRSRRHLLRQPTPVVVDPLREERRWLVCTMVKTARARRPPTAVICFDRGANLPVRRHQASQAAARGTRDPRSPCAPPSRMTVSSCEEATNERGFHGRGAGQS